MSLQKIEEDYFILKQKLINSTRNDQISDFIQEMRFKIKDHHDTVLEWIPYDQFDKIKEIKKIGFITAYSAIWKDSPLHKENENSNKEVTLNYLHNSQHLIEFLINKIRKYLTNQSNKYKDHFKLYGISQNPGTNNYILVQNDFINLVNWISGNKQIDDFIQGTQLKINDHDDILFEWIPYDQFNEIKEMTKNSFITIYTAIWKDGLSHKKDWWHDFAIDSNEKVVLKCLHNLQNPIEFLTNEINKYLSNKFGYEFLKIYGISQNQNTNDYILVFNWKSGNEKIDDFIQEMKVKIKDHQHGSFEWIPYNQFNEIKETGKNGFITIYSAIWKDGPLSYKNKRSKYERDSNKEVVLKCLHNSQDSIEFLINEVKEHSIKDFLILYGISQNPDTNDYILVQNNFIWTSGNEKIDEFIQEMQLEIKDYDDIVFEWIPYSQFNEIKEIVRYDLITVYSALWKGPLRKCRWDNEYTRNSRGNIALKCLHNSQNPVESLINEVKKHSIKDISMLYGISQNPDTNDYILVQNNFICASGNEKIDEFIQQIQLKIKYYNDIVFEWIQYNRFNGIKETGRNGFMTIYSAIWEYGPLSYKYSWRKTYEREREFNKKVTLKCLHDSQYCIEFLINEAKEYLNRTNKYMNQLEIYGISQNPDTNDYILVFNWTSGYKKIDDFIQEMQLEIKANHGVRFEWIPYNQFDEIIETGKNCFMTVYSAKWNNKRIRNYERDSNKEVILKCLHNSQNPIDSLIYEVKKYYCRHKFLKIYGMSQNQDTKDFVLVQNNFIWTSENKEIDNFVQEMQLEIKDNNDIVFEWIPYSQFYEIKETGKNGLVTVYSAIWKDGPLCYAYNDYKRNMYEKVALKCWHNSENPIESLINEVKKHTSNKFGNWSSKIYGISQNSDTNEYILVFNWTSGNEKIDDFIQEMQFEANNPVIVYEWIPYNQFNKIKKIGKGGFSTIYLAIWKYNKVALKCLDNSQILVNELLNEVKAYSTKVLENNSRILKVYGIPQDPDT
ncbi:hypothetical protein RirG_150820 [Rhizophagus irregularis DAOM 197198w]|uniref:Protein kinase domain-containing protein n=1 Tax=Rhizophagus irregularis (strain DAOM 197198w) TaxID=1432141 RepID=A0A015M9U0_RHIIW|nr:hypothetical protein RirG_150820 [Rhizophagus irregularis DAOM 197198w]